MRATVTHTYGSHRYPVHHTAHTQHHATLVAVLPNLSHRLVSRRRLRFSHGASSRTTCYGPMSFTHQHAIVTVSDPSQQPPSNSKPATASDCPSAAAELMTFGSTAFLSELQNRCKQTEAQAAKPPTSAQDAVAGTAVQCDEAAPDISACLCRLDRLPSTLETSLKE
jgi:hypothetical protein